MRGDAWSDVGWYQWWGLGVGSGVDWTSSVHVRVEYQRSKQESSCMGMGPATTNQLLDAWVSGVVSSVDDEEGRGWQAPRAVLDKIPIEQVVSLTRSEK